MKDSNYTIKENRKVANDIFKMVLIGDRSDFSRPGQFVNIKLEGLYLRRPISVMEYTATSFTIIYKVVGKGTLALSLKQAGEILSILAPLGNGYDLSLIGSIPVLVGGGVGVPPMYGLAKSLCEMGVTPTVILGFNNIEDVFGVDDFKSLGITPIITTVDGTLGTKGFVTDVLPNLEYDYICACGPEPMLKALSTISTRGQFSFEARMACGFGACMGCTCETKYGYKRICKEGPVLLGEEIIW